MRLGRSTGHPGRASTTPEMSVTGPDGWAEPVPAWRTPHEALTRTRAAVGSNHRACGPNHRIVTVTAAWTVRWACRFPPRGGRVVLGRVHPAALDHSGGSPPSRPGRGHGADESGDQVDAGIMPGLRQRAFDDLQRVDGRHDHGAGAISPAPVSSATSMPESPAPLPRLAPVRFTAALPQFALDAAVSPGGVSAAMRITSGRILAAVAVRGASGWCSPTCGRRGGGARRVWSPESQRTPHATGGGGSAGTAPRATAGQRAHMRSARPGGAAPRFRAVVPVARRLSMSPAGSVASGNRAGSA
jgi:hypothetical protein